MNGPLLPIGADSILKGALKFLLAGCSAETRDCRLERINSISFSVWSLCIADYGAETSPSQTAFRTSVKGR